MYIRIDDVNVGAGHVDELRDVLSDNAPVLIGQEGCEGLSCTADRATGNCAIVSLWNSKRSLERSAQAIAAIRTATDFYDTEVVPRLRSQPGFLNSRLIRDLEHHGRCSAVSHWTDANALKASDSSTAVREQITKTGATIERISTSEIILADLIT